MTTTEPYIMYIVVKKSAKLSDKKIIKYLQGFLHEADKRQFEMSQECKKLLAKHKMNKKNFKFYEKLMKPFYYWFHGEQEQVFLQATPEQWEILRAKSKAKNLNTATADNVWIGFMPMFKYETVGLFDGLEEIKIEDVEMIKSGPEKQLN